MPACSKTSSFIPRDIPASDHYDGSKFFNPGVATPGFGAVLKWQFNRDHGPWPDTVALAETDTPPARVTDNQLRLSYIGHSTVLLQTAGLNIITDPIYSERASPISFLGPKRVHPPGVVWEHLPKIDIIVISHNHYDHLDLPTLEKLVTRDAPLIIVPLGNGSLIAGDIPAARIVELDWGETHTVGLPNNPYQNAAITLTPAQHWSSRRGYDKNKALWGSYVIKTAGGGVYFAGDTGYGPHFKAIASQYGPFRAALLPIGAYLPRWVMGASHMGPDEAVQAYRDLGNPPTVALHYTTFNLADEAYGQAAQDLGHALTEQGIVADAFCLLPPGQSWTIGK